MLRVLVHPYIEGLIIESLYTHLFDHIFSSQDLHIDSTGRRDWGARGTSGKGQAKGPT